MPKFTFQQSKIMEAGDPVDPMGEKRRIKARREVNARRQLPKLIGRSWVLIKTEE